MQVILHKNLGSILIKPNETSRVSINAGSVLGVGIMSLMVSLLAHESAIESDETITYNIDANRMVLVLMELVNSKF